MPSFSSARPLRSSVLTTSIGRFTHCASAVFWAAGSSGARWGMIAL
jgi:hypothetical protein